MPTNSYVTQLISYINLYLRFKKGASEYRSAAVLYLCFTWVMYVLKFNFNDITSL